MGVNFRAQVLLGVSGLEVRSKSHRETRKHQELEGVFLSGSEFWEHKIIALLHDPPLKHLIVEGRISVDKNIKDSWRELTNKVHEAFSFEIMKILGIDQEKIKKAIEIVRKADGWAAGADRPPFKEEESKSRDIVFRHPVKGNEHSLKTSYSYNPLSKVLELMKSLKTAIENLDEKTKYLFLWRFLPEIFEQVFPDASFWPADTRWCDHTLWTHLDLTSAFTGAALKSKGHTLEDKFSSIGLLYIKIPGPQRLIQGSKKYRELWGGSHLMALISAKIISIIMEELGPDAVVYPSLRENTFVDAFILYGKFKDIKSDNEVIKKVIEDFKKKSTDTTLYRISALPNKIVAIISKDVKEYLQEKIENEVRVFLEKALDLVQRRCNLSIPPDKNALIKEILYSRFHPKILFLTFREVMEYVRNTEDIPSNIKELRDAIEEYFNVKCETYKIKPSMYYEITRRLLEAIDKHEKIRESIPEIPKEAYACEICGNAPALIETTIDGQLKNICPICLIKIYYKDVIEELLNDEFRDSTISVGESSNIRFPFASHVEISLKSAFSKLSSIKGSGKPVEGLMEKLTEILELLDPYIKRKEKSFEHFKENKTPMEFINNVIEYFRVNGLDIEIISMAILGTLPTDNNKLREYLIESGYSRNIEEKELDKLRELLNDLKKIVNEVNKNSSFLDLVRHYALVMFDGDSIGKLLSRRDIINDSLYPLEKFTTLSSEDFKNWVCNHELKFSTTSSDYFKNLKALPTPSYHKQVSESLLNFTLSVIEKLVKQKPEDLFCEIIYAGGDDILMICDVKSVSCVLKILRDTIRGTYEGRIILPGWQGSAGVVIAHYKHPFYLVINSVRERERAAKDFRREKDATSIHVILNSGPAEVFTISNTLRTLRSGKEEHSLVYAYSVFSHINSLCNKYGGSLKSFIQSLLRWGDLLKDEKGRLLLDAPIIGGTSLRNEMFTALIIKEIRRHIITSKLIKEHNLGKILAMKNFCSKTEEGPFEVLH